MTAFRLMDWQDARFADVDVPEPGPDDVRIAVTAVGLCHTDLHFLEMPAGILPYSLPFTLGHETAGVVDRVGSSVTGLAVGDAVAVAGIHSCGRCDFCVRGHDNACVRSQVGRGYGEDGGLAQYLVVPQRELVLLRTLDPQRAAPLTDAGVTSYHAVKKVLPNLEAGSVAVVIGVGGLGGYAVQYLRLLSAATVVAVDTAERQVARARELGAHHSVSSGDELVALVRDLTGGHGAAGVFDFVVTDDTTRTALACARAYGAVALVGAGGGTAAVGWGVPPQECAVFTTMGATVADLREVVALAEQGRLRIDIERFPFADTAAAYDAFRSGTLEARAVVTL